MKGETVMNSIRIAFKSKSATAVEFQNGAYSRRFDPREQPFEVTPVEWPYLRRTGYFEQVVDVATSQQTEQQQNSTNKAEGNSSETNMAGGTDKSKATGQKRPQR